MKTVAVIQARMGSTRLPGKVLMPLGGQPVLDWVWRACKAAPGIDQVVVATSDAPADDRIVQRCKDRRWDWWRGSETDVLQRIHGAALYYEASIILRLTGDCPFLDPRVIGEVVALYKHTTADYCSNIHPRTYPDGLDVECFSMWALKHAHATAQRPIDRDTVTQWIVRNRSRFPAEAVINPLPGMQNERWVLDTADDYDFCQAVVAEWPWYNGPPSMLDILRIVDGNPELRKLNAHHPMNERFYEALAQEPVYKRSYPRSQAQLDKARKVIPLGAQTFSKSHLQFPQPSPLFVTHGAGGLVWDADGNEYVDLVSALLPNVLGYADPDVDAAIRRQLCSGISFSLATELEAQLAETLCRLIPCAEMVRFGKTGTDATTAAVRLARAYTGRERILLMSGGYHGWADWSIERNLGVPTAVGNLTDRITIDATLLMMGNKLDQYAAIILEGDRVAIPRGMKWIREACEEHGIVLIFDEVITGFRYHLGGAQKLYGVTPDLACFGKAMANGMPLSAVVGRRDIMMRMEPPDNIFYSGTFFGETLSLAASIATIEKMEREDTVKKLWTAGTNLSDRVETLIANYGLEDEITLYGEPPYRRLKFKNDKIGALFRKEMIASGTLIIASHNVCAAHGPNEIRRVRNSYEHAFEIIRNALTAHIVDKLLAGGTIAPGVR